jgi:hypothetical protein
MSCRGCRDYERMTLIEFRTDLDAMSDLLLVIARGRGGKRGWPDSSPPKRLIRLEGRDAR